MNNCTMASRLRHLFYKLLHDKVYHYVSFKIIAIENQILGSGYLEPLNPPNIPR